MTSYIIYIKGLKLFSKIFLTLRNQLENLQKKSPTN